MKGEQREPHRPISRSVPKGDGQEAEETRPNLPTRGASMLDACGGQTSVLSGGSAVPGTNPGRRARLPRRRKGDEGVCAESAGKSSKGLGCGR